jgi:hypothetical protein
MENLTINQKVYVVFSNGRMQETKIVGLGIDNEIITGYLEMKGHNNYNTTFKGNKGSHEYAYNKGEYFTFFTTLKEALEYKKESVIKTLNTLKVEVEKSMDKLIEYRKSHYDILNTDDLTKWVQDFKNNNNY